MMQEMYITEKGFGYV